jgi:predicted metalloenzyme YecM
MDYKKFLDNIFTNLNESDIDVGGYELDHIAYRATTNQSFDKVGLDLNQVGMKIFRNVIRNRFIDIYKLNTPIKYLEREIKFIELLAPAEGDTFNEGLEHVEFVVDNYNLHEFIEKHSSLSWNTNSIDREIGAEVGIKFENGANVKFKTMSMPEIIRLESNKK